MVITAAPVLPEVVEEPRKQRRRVEVRTWAMVGLVLLSVGLRIWLWVPHRSFWLDEQYIALVIKQLPPSGLVGMLPMLQSAPVLWLWLEKALMAVSLDEHLLRLPSLIASCVSVVVTVPLVRRLFRLPAQFVVVSLIGITPTMVWYSALMKPYVIDLCCTSVLLLLSVRAVRDKGQSAYWYAAAVAIWVSQTAEVVVATGGAILLGTAVVRRTWKAYRVPVTVAAISFLVDYAVHLRPNIGYKWMLWWWPRYFPIAFPPQPLSAHKLVDWTVDCYAAVVQAALPAGSHMQALLVLELLAVGAVLLVRRDRMVAALVVAPLLAGWLMTVGRLYPMYERLGVWMVPLFLVLLGQVVESGTDLVRDRERLRVRVAAAVVGVLVIGGGAAVGYHNPTVLSGSITLTAVREYGRTEEALRFVARNTAPGDTVFLHRYSVSAAQWYGPRVGLHWDGQFEFPNAPGHFPTTSLLPVPATGHTQWLIVGQLFPGGLDLLRAELDRRGRILLDRPFGMVDVLRYRADPKPSSPIPVIILYRSGQQIIQEDPGN